MQMWLRGGCKTPKRTMSSWPACCSAHCRPSSLSGFRQYAVCIPRILSVYACMAALATFAMLTLHMPLAPRYRLLVRCSGGRTCP